MTLALRRRTLAAGAGAWLLGGCFGSFGATRALYAWNERVDDNKWLRWLVFLVFIILPVYSLFVLADVLVLNTIEFFSGENPIRHTQLGDGHTLRTSHTHERNLVKHEICESGADGQVVRTLYMRLVARDTLVVLDEQMRVIGRACKLADGTVELRDGAGRVISRHAAPEVARAEAALSGSASPSRAVAAASSSA